MRMKNSYLKRALVLCLCLSPLLVINSTNQFHNLEVSKYRKVSKIDTEVTAAQDYTFGVHIGDIFEWICQDGNYFKIIVTDVTDTAVIATEYIGEAGNWITPHSGLSVTQIFEWEQISYNGYIWPIPTNYTAIHINSEYRFYTGPADFTANGNTMFVTDPTDPGYTCNITYNDFGLVTRYELIDNVRDFFWYNLSYVKSSSVVSGSAIVEASGTANQKISLDITATDSVNVTLVSKTNNPTQIDLASSSLFLSLEVNDTSKVTFPVSLEINYDEDDLNNLNIEENDLQLYYFNGEKEKWQKVDQEINKENNIITAQLDHLSIYGLGIKEKGIPSYNLILMMFISVIGLVFVNMSLVKKIKY
ncbi:MAG: hypothetical protein GF364_04425 [Candidatus Lokiarchaeota archaeon]|nr:hypothetical protein [Candidatus Lokiarchaeota archaeon]